MNKPTDKDQQPKRRAYEKPQIVSDESFETLALSCGKANVDDCFFGPIKS